MLTAASLQLCARQKVIFREPDSSLSACDVNLTLWLSVAAPINDELKEIGGALSVSSFRREAIAKENDM